MSPKEAVLITFCYECTGRCPSAWGSAWVQDAWESELLAISPFHTFYISVILMGRSMDLNLGALPLGQSPPHTPGPDISSMALEFVVRNRKAAEKLAVVWLEIMI